MARILGPDAATAYVFDKVTGKPVGGELATVYADAAGTTLASIAQYDPLAPSTPGPIVSGSVVEVDENSRITFWFPDGVKRLWVRVNGGPLTEVTANLQDQIDLLATAIAAIETGGATVQVPDGAITNAKVSASAGIELSKLETNPLNRDNHTGTQNVSTITGLGGAATLNVGSAAGTVTAGDDSRLSNARTPTTHAVSHGTGGSDPVTVAQSQVTGLGATLNAKADLVLGKIPTSQIPAVAINTTFTVASQAAMLALAATQGDVAIRTDFTPAHAYQLAAPDPAVLGNWVQVDLGGVTSINTQTGVVVLDAADVGAAPETRQITSGTGLTGGGDLTANRTLSVSYGTAAGTAAQGNDTRIDGAAQKDQNLSDLASPATARTNLGLGTSATRNVGITSGTVAAGDDSRLTNARTPTAHATSHAPGGTDPLAGLTSANMAAGSVDGAAGTASLRTLGTGAQQAAAGADSRITGAAQKDQNLADLGSVATARTNLSLGGAAVLNVGTTAGTVAAGDDSRITTATPSTRSIATNAPLTGGGDLSANRTLGVADATTSTVGVVKLAGDLAGTAALPVVADQAITSAKLADLTIVDGDIATGAAITPTKVAGTALVASNNLSDVTAATARTNLGVPPSTRSIGTSGALSGGGDLSIDRTLSVADASTGAKGVVQLTGDLAGSATAPLVLNKTDVINITDPAYGAVAGASSSVNGPAFTAAVTAAIAAGLPVFVPPGTYDIGSASIALSANKNFAIFGAGWQSSKLTCTGAFLTAVSSSDQGRVADLMIQCTTTTNTLNCIDIDYPRRWTIERCYIQGFGGDSIKLGGGLHTVVRHNYLLAKDAANINGHAGIYVTASSAGPSTGYATTIITQGNYVGTGKQFGYLWEYAVLSISMNDIVENCSVSMRLHQAGVHIDTFYAESNTTDGPILFDSPVTITGHIRFEPSSVTWTNIATADRYIARVGRNFIQTGKALVFGGGTAGVDPTAYPSIRSGAGSPEAAQTAVRGSVWLRTDGAGGTTIYIKETATGNTGWAALAGGGVASTRSIATTAPLSGGGDLSADRTLTVSNATTGTVGVVQIAGDLAGTATAPTIATGAVTSAKIADGTIVDGDISGSAAIAATKISGTALVASNNLSDVTAATARTNLAVPPSSRTLTAGTGLTGGGDLSADRTFAVAYGTAAGTAAQGDDSRITGAAPLASPTFTGTPAAPTAAPGTNTTQVATTAFVAAADALKANLASPALTGTPTAPTPTAGTNTTQLATTAFATTGLAAKPDRTSLDLNVADYGAVGDGTTDDTTAVQAAITATTTGSRLVFPPGKNYLVGGLAINNKTNVTIDGNGATITYKATGARIGLLLTGTCTNVTVQNLTVQGNANVTDAHCGMGFASGQTIVAAKFLNNRIIDCTLGITMQADSSGTMRDCLVQGNHVENVVGTASGYGYGIHHANSSTTPDGTRIVGNLIRGAQRHSIYHAKGGGSAIANNTILDHRATVGDGSLLSALMIARSGDVQVTGNNISGGKDSFMTIGGTGASDGGTYARNLNIVGNSFINPLDTVPMVIVGTQDPTIDGFCEAFNFTDNIIWSNLASTLLQIYSGKRGRIAGNQFLCTVATGTATGIRVTGQSEGSGTANYTDDITIDGNTFRMASGGTKFPINLGGSEATGIKLDVRDNKFTTPGNIFGVVGSVSNPNITVAGQPKTGLTFASGIGPLGAPNVNSRRAIADANVTIAHADQTIAYTSITAARVATLPSAADGNGMSYTIKDESGSCSASNTITVTPASGTIDGASTLLLSAAYARTTVYSNGTNWFVADLTNGTFNRQAFAAGSGTWTNPSPTVARQVVFKGVSGGSGGGSGRRGADGTLRTGGGGGAAGIPFEVWMLTTDLPTSVAVTVGAGGGGGAAVTADSTDGNVGTSGGSTYLGAGVGTYRIGAGNTSVAGGRAGNATGAAAGGTSAGAGPAGGASSATGAAGTGGGSLSLGTGLTLQGPTAGGAGGGLTTGNAESTGGAGGTWGGLITGGTAGAVGGGAGGAGAASPTGSPGVGGLGGGGGGSSDSAATAGGTGGAGAAPGGGGGGGGASVNGANSGAGGAGADGYLVALTFL